MKLYGTSNQCVQDSRTSSRVLMFNYSNKIRSETPKPSTGKIGPKNSPVSKISEFCEHFYTKTCDSYCWTNKIPDCWSDERLQEGPGLEVWL